VVGDEGAGGGAAGGGLEDGRLHLQEAAAVQEAAYGGDDAGAGEEGIAEKIAPRTRSEVGRVARDGGPARR